MCKEGSKDLLLVVLGSILGAVIALLFAPKSGKNLRSDISEQSNLAVQKGSDITKNVKEKSTDIAKKVSDQSSQLVEKTKDAVEGMKNNDDSEDENNSERNEENESETESAQEDQ